MLKKLFIAGLAVAAGLFVLNSTHLGSYAKTAWSKARASLHRQVTPEFELENARREVAELIPEMKQHVSAIAAEYVQVANLKEEVAALHANLDKKKDVVRAMNNQLKADDTQKISFGDRVYTRTQLQKRLARELDTCKQLTKEIDAKESLLEAREQGLVTAREQLDNIKHQKEELEVQIAQMEAELKSLRLAQTRTSFQLDDSRLSRIKQSLADVRTKIATERKAMEMYAQFDDDGSAAPAEKKIKSAVELRKEVEDFLAADGAKTGNPVATDR